MKFVQLEAKIANDPVFSCGVLGKIQVPERSVKGKTYGRDNPMYKQNNHATKVEESENVRKMQDQCPFCKETHDLDGCQSFLKRSLEERKTWRKEKSMCYACYKTGRRANGCLQRRTCKTCNGKHPTSLHDPEFASKIKMKKQQDEKSKPDKEPGLNNAHTICDQAVRSMPIVPVKLRANDKEITTYAMLDNCSTGTFILEDVRRELEAEKTEANGLISLISLGTETNVIVNTMNGSKVHQTTVVTGLVVMDLSGNDKVNLPRTFHETSFLLLERRYQRTNLLLSGSTFGRLLINYQRVYRKLRSEFSLAQIVLKQ